MSGKRSFLCHMHDESAVAYAKNVPRFRVGKVSFRGQAQNAPFHPSCTSLQVTEKWFSLPEIKTDFPSTSKMRLRHPIFALLMLSALSGCASLVTSAGSQLANNLSGAILNQDDPETVEAGAPAYLLLVDSLIEGDPGNENLLLSGSRLYGAYASAFIKEQERISRFTRKARDYSDRALCVHGSRLCNLMERPYDDFFVIINTLKVGDVPVLYASGTAWAGWIQANSGDWNAIASLAKVKAMMARVVELNETYDHGEAHLYLGVMAALLPPALGGRPEDGRVHFERAIELSGGHDLMDKVEYARRYARITYDRPLHDRLLREVLDAGVAVPGLTLSNVLAKRQARELLKSADSYFLE